MKRLFFFILALLSSACFAASATFTADATTDIPNPDRGWAGYTGGDFVNGYSAASVTSAYAKGERLGYCYLDIGAFRGTTISAGYLTTLGNNLESLYAAGQKCVITVFYDYSSAGNDDTAANIVVHANQLAAVFKAKPYAIGYITAGFIGAYGEWWGSQHANSCGYSSGATTCATANANRLTIRNAILAAYKPIGVPIQFRYADDHIQWWPTPLSAAKAFTGDPQARTGALNECQLSSANDSGTFSTNSSGASSAQLAAYWKSMLEWLPYGGELSNSCATPHRTDCPSALSDFAAYHLSWLKDVSGPPSDMADWTNGWASGGCTNTINIGMGYRLVYDSFTHADTMTHGTSNYFYLTMHNTGFSRVHTARLVQLRLVKGGASDIVCTFPQQLRLLPSNASASTSMRASCPIPSGATLGSYAVHLEIPDVYPNPETTPSKAFRIQPANVNSGGQVWDAANRRFATGTTVVVN
jgi:hypothetical protein